MGSLPQPTMECLVQSPSEDSSPVVSYTQPIPLIREPFEVLIKVAAVALNPTDFKSAISNHCPGAIMGCDFAGVVVTAASEAPSYNSLISVGSRVCGLVHGSNPGNPNIGSFAEYLVTDVRQVVRVPDSWSFVDAAALGGVGWGTVALVMETSLKLPGCPSNPAPPLADGSRTPVLVYGAATATGTMACQMLSISGYDPITTSSAASSALVKEYGAVAIVPYSSPTCGETIRDEYTKGKLRHALDCISSPESVEACFKALGRIGTRYACLDYVPEPWRTRKAVKVDNPLTYSLHGKEIKLEGHYHRDADPALFELGLRWREEVQMLVDQGRLKPHPTREIQGRWQGIMKGLEMLKEGKVRGQKLVVGL